MDTTRAKGRDLTARRVVGWRTRATAEGYDVFARVLEAPAGDVVKPPRVALRAWAESLGKPVSWVLKNTPEGHRHGNRRKWERTRRDAARMVATRAKKRDWQRAKCAELRPLWEEQRAAWTGPGEFVGFHTWRRTGCVPRCVKRGRPGHRVNAEKCIVERLYTTEQREAPMSPVKSEPRTERVTVAVTKSMYELLERYAAAHDQTLSAAVGDFLEEAQQLLVAVTKLAEHNKKKKQAMLERSLRVAPKPR